MRLKSKRLISLLLAGSMMVSMLPASAVTAFAETANNVAVAESSNTTESVVLSVTVNPGESLETAVKNAATAEQKDWRNITNLIVTTAAGKELDRADFQFLSGVVVDYKDGYRYSAKAVNPTNSTAGWKYTGEAFDWLSNLKVLDLTDATCENNAIPPRAFQYNSNITKVFLPENLNRTYLHAFSTMENLEYLGTKSGNLCFPNTMTIMGEGMLYEDTKISGSLSLPASLTAIGAACFCHTQISGEVVIPGNVNISVNTDLGKDGKYGTSDFTFSGTKITSLTLEDGVINKEIGKSFASGCADLATVSIPKSIHKIGDSAFKGTKLQSLPDLSNVTSLGASAFREIPTDGIPGDITINCETVGDSALRGIKINGNVTINSDTIGQYILYDSTVNGNLTINSNTIGSQTLRNTTINGTLTINTKNPTSELLSYAKINNGLVVGSENIPRSFIPNVTDAQYDATNRIGGQLVLESGVQTVGDSAFNNAGIIGKLVLPEGLQTIGGSAFRHNQFSGTIVIPKSVKEIGVAAFSFVGGGAASGSKADAQNTEKKVDTIIVENPDISLEQYAFANQKEGVKIYFPKDVQNTNNNRWSNSECIILNTDGGTIPTDGNGNVTAKMDDTTGLYTPTKDGYKFVGWCDADGNNLITAAKAGKTYYAVYKTLHTVTFDDGVDSTTDSTVQVADGETVAKPETDPKKDGYKFDYWCAANGNKVDFPLPINADITLTAKWTPYKTKVEPKVETNADPASKTVEITVNVEAAPAELAGATATLNFTDANGNDDRDNVAEVKVNGKTFNQNADGKYTAKLNALMPTPDASENGAETAMLADVNAGAVVPGTVNGTARLTVTYKTPGKHNVGIVLNAVNGDVICKEIATVEIAPEPGTLNLTGCTAKLEDGTPVENGAKVPVGAEVTVTFEQDADSDLVLNGWNVTPETLTDTNGKLVKDITAETFTFKMPETDEGVTIAAQTKAAAPAEDDSMDAAAVVTGVVLGTGTAILAYHIGTEVYAEQVLGKGVAIPRTREEVALKAWELAGKPAVELNGEPLSEAAQAEKWAVESGLMQNVDGSFNGSKKMSKLKALRTLDAAKKLG